MPINSKVLHLFLTIGIIISLIVTLTTASPITNIHRIDILGANVFILETDDALFMIDAGYSRFESTIIKKIKSLKKSLRLILLTHGHFDHFGCVGPVKEATGALVAIHQLDAEDLCNGKTTLDSVDFVGSLGKMILPLAQSIFPPRVVCPDFYLNDNDTLNHFGLDARVVHTPGHTRGSCTIIVQDSIAFAGDLIISFPAISKQHYYANSWAQIDSSINKLITNKFSLLYTGHRKKTADHTTIENLMLPK